MTWLLRTKNDCIFISGYQRQKTIVLVHMAYTVYTESRSGIKMEYLVRMEKK